MPHFTLDDHPYDRALRVEYGYDPDARVRFFVIAFYDDPEGKPILIHDASHCGCVGLGGALQFLRELHFFTSFHLEEALDAFAAPEPVSVSPAARRVLQVIQNFVSARFA